MPVLPSWNISPEPWSGSSSSAFTSINTQSGIVTNVPADGSAAFPVTYSTPFPTSTTSLVTQIVNNFQTNNWELTIQVTNVTNVGFTLNVAGAPSGQTVNVYYIATGA